MLWGVLISCVLILNGCNKKTPVITASNEHYNTHYKNQVHISPIGNVLADKQEPELLQRNYQYYSRSYEIAKNKYESDKQHMLFLVKNDNIVRIKNISVESVPHSNKEYIVDVAQATHHRDINKKAHLEIEYAMFLNDAKLAKKFKENNGDPIIHPYVYTDIAEDKRRTVIGDEYYSWESICQTRGENC